MLTWKKARPKAKTANPAPEIVYRRVGADWEASIENPDGRPLQVLVEDVGGQPNPEFVPKVPEVVGALSELEQKARTGEPDLAGHLTDDHHLSLITETHPKADFALGFVASGMHSETVIVDFSAGDVVSWCFLAEPAQELSLAR